MQNRYEEMVREFTEAAQQPLDQDVTAYDITLRDMRRSLLEEEHDELKAELKYISYLQEHDLSIREGDIHNLFKEVADLQYVLTGLIVTYGIPLDEIMEEVHKSNMSKFHDGEARFRADGKLLKNPSYEPADLTEIVKKYLKDNA